MQVNTPGYGHKEKENKNVKEIELIQTEYVHGSWRVPIWLKTVQGLRE